MKSTILTMGLSHTTAPIHVREQIALSRCTRHDDLDPLRFPLDPDLLPERLILSTCNRTEIYAVTPDRARGEQALRALFAGRMSFAPSANLLYTYADRDAVAHLFAVSSGIDSQIVGEFEILGQVRAAYLEASQHRLLGPLLHQLFQDALRVGKRARSETSIGAGAASVAYAAVALARQELGELRGRHALVVGAGEMARRAAQNLAEDGACTVVVANRTYAHALELARDLRGRAIRFDELPAALAAADLVISATGAPHTILDAPLVAAAMQHRPAQPLCLVDIALPRDIDPAVAQIANVRLSNLDDLKEMVDANRALREAAVSQVRLILAEEVERFWKWYETRRAAPLIRELYAHAEAIQAAEVEKALRQLAHLNLDAHDRNVIAALSSGITGKLLAAPTAHLKARVQSGDGQLYLDVLREFFELDAPSHRGEDISTLPPASK